MSTATSEVSPRAPRPWPVRLAAWIAALAVICFATVLVIQSGTFGSTTHTVAAEPLALDRGTPADSVSEVGRLADGAAIVGPVAVKFTTHGVIAFDPTTGDEQWRYERDDTPVCASNTAQLRVVLLYRNGDRCDEAIALDAASGTRSWQRTIEASAANTITWTADGFISLDAQKMISYSNAQGYEQFTLDTMPDNATPTDTSRCENLGAAGAPTVVTLQQCQADPDSPMIAQLVVNQASDGKPREIGRSYLSAITEPTLVGASSDGTAYIRDSAGQIHVFPVGIQSPMSITGLPSVSAEVSIVSTRGGTILTADGMSYGLSASLDSIAWTQSVLAPPTIDSVFVYLPTTQGIEVRASDTLSINRTIPATLPGTNFVSFSVSGPYIAFATTDNLTVFR